MTRDIIPKLELHSTPNNSLQRAEEELANLAHRLIGVPIVITGGSGFLGLSLVGLFEKFGLESDVLDITFPSQQVAAQFNFARTRFHQVDLCATNQVHDIGLKLPERFVLIHAASKIGTNQQIDAQGVNDLQVESSIATNLVEAFSNRISHFVMTSSIDVYGTPSGILNENHEENPDRTYGLGKMIAERLFQTGGKLHHYAVSILRIGHVYGPLEHVYSQSHQVRSKRAIPNFLRKAIQQEQITISGDGSDLRDFVHTWDVVQAVFRSILFLTDDTFIIASGISQSIRDIAMTALRLCGNPNELVFQERKTEQIDYKISIDKACRVLGYRPMVEFQDGLEQELAWMNRVGLNA